MALGIEMLVERIFERTWWVVGDDGDLHYSSRWRKLWSDMCQSGSYHSVRWSGPDRYRFGIRAQCDLGVSWRQLHDASAPITIC